MDGQPRISDLVPQTYVKLTMLFCAGLAIIAGLEALYFYMPRLAAQTTDGTIAAFDLDCEGSLGTWFSSLMLGVTALVSLFVFSVRRNKADDYHGRYRIWLWVALVFFVMSIDEAASLHEGFKELMARVAGTRIHGDGSLWWVMAYGLILLPVGLRLTFQISACRTSLVACVLGVGCLGAGVATQLEWILPQSGAQGIMVEEGLEMLGYLLTLTGFALFARYVILESQGLLGVKRVKRVKSKKKEAAPTVDDKAPIKPTASSPASISRPATAGSTSGSMRVDAPHASGQRRPSKAERRALRKQQHVDREYD